MQKPAINSTFLDNFTVLHLSAQRNLVVVSRVLLKLGANVNAISSFGRTPLMIAVLKKNLKMVSFLLNNNANIDIQDREKNTCTHFASEKGFIEILKLILEKKPNL